MRFRIYYGPGCDPDIYDGDPYLAPGLGVICIAQPDPDIGRHVLSGMDYYWWDHDQWWCGDLFGLYEYLQGSGPKKVVFGRTISNRDFRRILKTGCEDPDFPRKSGWKRGERKL